jgi:transposase
MDQLGKIIKLSEKNKFRSEIAKTTNLSENTIYKWQKKFDLV